VHGHACVWHVEFPSTIEANLVRTVFDGEHPALMTMSAAKEKLKGPKKRFHKSCARWRRSRIPFTRAKPLRPAANLDMRRTVAESEAGQLIRALQL
jgi:hypothetical protein